MPGTVSAVKPFGIFVQIEQGIPVLVYVHAIPEASGGPRLSFFRQELKCHGPRGDLVPDLDLGDTVEQPDFTVSFSSRRVHNSAAHIFVFD